MEVARDAQSSPAQQPIAHKSKMMKINSQPKKATPNPDHKTITLRKPYLKVPIPSEFFLVFRVVEAKIADKFFYNF